MDGHWNQVERTPAPSLRQKISTAIQELVGPEDIAKAESQSTKMLLSLTASGKHVYQGTVPKATVARRRARNKAARIARRAAR